MIVAGNWKMFAGPDPTALAARLAGVSGVEAIVCPPYVSLARCVGAGLTTYAQNVHWELEGAYTGEISPSMLLALGVAGSLVGHSERRQYFGETDAGVARRAQAGLEAGLGVIACVGETQEERDAGDMETVLRIQVDAIRDTCGAHERLVLAYEPVWAIGTGRTATPDDAAVVHRVIRAALVELVGESGRAVPILYGGSVTPANASSLLADDEVDGLLVGGASLDPTSWAAVCSAIARTSSN